MAPTIFSLPQSDPIVKINVLFLKKSDQKTKKEKNVVFGAIVDVSCECQVMEVARARAVQRIGVPQEDRSWRVQVALATPGDAIRPPSTESSNYKTPDVPRAKDGRENGKEISTGSLADRSCSDPLCNVLELPSTVKSA